ncbi:HlyD family secretion protein [Flavobacterium amniphilum]|uniref:HlyD family secretion protein n=1 Tax=Flavobacterium amniphilum TaxID=1834035 RepID=UPI002029DF52|nr:HlyD family efflux transporter periplasmic adaptor subunit [Flavobacterium amniphilum]MCL9805868.1 HlyD family secretion protein [Flavobacterium amniphilum]
MNFSQDPIHTIENLIAKNKTKSISLYVVLVLAVIVLLLSLPIIKVDVSSQSRGIVRSSTDKVPLQVLVNGKVTELKLRNNCLVQKGDTLLKIAQDNLQTEKSTTIIASNDNQSLIDDLQKVSTGNASGLKTEVIVQEWYSYQTRKSELEEKLHYAQTEYNRQKQLYEKDVIATAEFDKYKHQLTTAKQALSILDKSQKAQWQNRCRELQEKSKNLSGTLNKIDTEAESYFVVAPVTGTIENFSGIQIGSFLNASQPVATISPIDNLIVECTVSPDDVGLIKTNQSVKFQIDAFNYNQWGLLEGKVFDIDKNITLQENQAFFKVRCNLNSKTMQLKSGYKTQISNGMTLTARYIITRRSLYDLLFDKVDDWLNPKIISTR